MADVSLEFVTFSLPIRHLCSKLVAVMADDDLISGGKPGRDHYYDVFVVAGGDRRGLHCHLP